MTFNSLPFFIFFAASLLFLFAVRKASWQKWGILIGSYYFYAQWDWRFMGLLFGLSTFTFLCCKGLRAAQDIKVKRLWLALQVTGSLVTLGWFKYANFFLDSIRPLVEGMGWGASTLDIILPVGISFIVFEVISYAVDVYRGDTPYEESFLDFSLLVAFFPHLVAGPILKPKDFLPQLKEATKITLPNMSDGAQLFLWGLMKKILVADRVAPFVDTVFKHPDSFSSPVVWLAVIAYGLQIYCDFSGYTDMAIGAAKMMGYDIPRNFDLPYLSTNITDFWRRWHISLSTWLRSYLYIPLGGNRKGLSRTYINLMLVMLLGGLWHGASWNFVLWGGLHGGALAVHKLWMDRKVTLPFPEQVLKGMGWALTLFFVLLAWVPFRSTDWGVTMTLLNKMLVPTLQAEVHWTSISVLLALPALLIADYGARQWYLEKKLQLNLFSHQFLFLFLLLSTMVVSPPAGSPFIYFQF